MVPRRDHLHVHRGRVIDHVRTQLGPPRVDRLSVPLRRRSRLHHSDGTVKTQRPILHSSCAYTVQPLVAVQTVLPMQKVATGTAIVVFHQFFGGSILLAIGQNIFQSHLVSSLIRNAPGVDPRAVIAAGAGAVRAIVPPEQLPGVLTAYNTALTNAFVSCPSPSMPFLLASLFGSLC